MFPAKVASCRAFVRTNSRLTARHHRRLSLLFRRCSIAPFGSPPSSSTYTTPANASASLANPAAPCVFPTSEPSSRSARCRRDSLRPLFVLPALSVLPRALVALEPLAPAASPAESRSSSWVASDSRASTMAPFLKMAILRLARLELQRLFREREKARARAHAERRRGGQAGLRVGGDSSS